MKINLYGNKIFYYYYLLVNFCINGFGLSKIYNIFGLSKEFSFAVLITFGFNVLIFVLFRIIFGRLFKYVLAFLIVFNAIFAYAIFDIGVEIGFDSIFATIQADREDIMMYINFKSFCFFSFFGILPTFLLLKLHTEKYNTIKIAKYHLIPLLIIVLFVSKYHEKVFRLGYRKSYSAYVLPYSYLDGVFFYIKKYTIPKMKMKSKPKICKDAIMSNKNENTLIVFVLGEASRRDRYSLNGYKKLTNPNLSQQSDLFNFSNVTSCATYTAKAVPCILSPLEREKFTLPVSTNNILDILQDFNFDVKWRGTQGHCYGTCINIKDVSYIKTHGWIDKIRQGDIVLRDELDKMIPNLNKNTFVVLHPLGSHGPYNAKFPTDMKGIFKPYKEDTESHLDMTKEELDNAYDNTILYTDYLLSEIIKTLEKVKDKNVMMFFTADHGDSLGENGVYGHSSPYEKAGDEQKQVPMMIWMNENFIKNYKINTQALKRKLRNSYSHDNVFHSILDVVGVEGDCVKKELSLFR
jgi:lipid A ethanolaminephosphotransferase